MATRTEPSNPFGLWKVVDIWEPGGFPLQPRRTRLLFYRGQRMEREFRWHLSLILR